MDYIVKLKKSAKTLFNDPWIWKMAYIDGKKNFNRLILFISSIILGIAALTAINSFNTNLQESINSQSKSLLGADLVVNSRKGFDSATVALFDTIDYEQSTDVRFASMALFYSPSGGTRLVQVVAREGNFPFYGDVEVLPEGAMDKIWEGRNIILDENLALQFEISSGDSVKIGQVVFKVAGIVENMPGANAFATTFAPSVYFSMEHLEATDLIQYGSRYTYKQYFKTEKSDEAEELLAAIRPELRKKGLGFDTVEEEREDVGEAFNNLYKFFNLLGFVALILGCIGVASSVAIYVQEKKNSIAVLRCLGASGWQSFNIFLIQAFFLGAIGSLVGVAVGVLLQFGIPLLFSSLIPVELDIFLVWPVLLQSWVLGVIISGIFSFLPLTTIRNIPPLIVLRSNTEIKGGFSKVRILVFMLAILFPWLFAVYQTDSLMNGSVFVGMLVASFLVLTLIAKLLIYLARRFFPEGWAFIWRQAFSNLFRPNNQTTVLVVVIGLGAFLVSTLLLIQSSLLGQVEFMGSDTRPNTVLFDIQPSQKDGVAELANSYDLPIQQMVPIVTTRLTSIKGKGIKEYQEDTSDNVPNWALTREYRVTYRDSLISSEKLLSGELRKLKSPSDTIWVSISTNMSENLEVDLNDELVFDVQGVPITAYVGSTREVDWQRIQTNFIFVFPEGILEQAPQFYVMMTRSDSKATSSVFFQDLVRQFPNISAIDLTLILKTIDEFLDKIAFVIEFMALFSIVTGLIVLAGAVINSKYARMKENVLLRTLGALKKQITRMTLIEYGYLGFFAGFAGILLAVAGSWILTIQFFEAKFVPDYIGLLEVWVLVSMLTMLVGWWNTRDIVNRSPLEILRKEV